jgi:hypothetical protein
MTPANIFNGILRDYAESISRVNRLHAEPPMSAKYVIFDLSGMVWWYDNASSKEQAIKKAEKEMGEPLGSDALERTHKLDADEQKLLEHWMDLNQATHLWPFDWRSGA